eukprot:TRINITY_DN4542_c0_g2_i2.p1 TRINITY_DN4542_c0_g2~~TRINITY_DN4542_c0_g2_i2.p1  ORF type:complete len:120 (-),score=14.04 TRINITY_DN4542_c0_g2_i2:122-481(-)
MCLPEPYSGNNSKEGLPSQFNTALQVGIHETQMLHSAPAIGHADSLAADHSLQEAIQGQLSTAPFLDFNRDVHLSIDITLVVLSSQNFVENKFPASASNHRKSKRGREKGEIEPSKNAS